MSFVRVKGLNDQEFNIRISSIDVVLKDKEGDTVIRAGQMNISTEANYEKLIELIGEVVHLD